MKRIVWVALACIAAMACGEGETEADRVGVGAQCTQANECESDDQTPLVCLTQFDGGYCGLSGCEGDGACPEGSACVRHTDMQTYCFRLCTDKPDCNRNRSEGNEANCVGSIEFVDARNGRKACEPPSSGL